MTRPGPLSPARYSAAMRPVLAEWLRGWAPVLDPMAGVGSSGIEGVIHGELEPEWAVQCLAPRLVADAGALPVRTGSIAAVVTSPCLTPDQRVLTADLRWVPSGDVQEGDRLIAFDEFGQGLTANGHRVRRKWRIARVIDSYPSAKECVRVHLADGTSVTCTVDHPWLVRRAKTDAVWVEAGHLLDDYRGSRVLKQLEPWAIDSSYDAGWLAGMLDGEGSLSFGVHGSPKLVVCQVEGPIADQVVRRFKSLGFEVSTLLRTNTPVHRQQMVNIYVSGGFPEVLRALGSLRPGRLLDKLDQLDVASRCVEPWEVNVEAVEPLGLREIQGITTSTGTYIGEGFLHHNTYGNRLADHHDAQDASVRHTYRHALGRPLHPRNTGQMQWGKAYQTAHRRIWAEVHRVLQPDGLLVVAISDHIRGGQRQLVVNWHIFALLELGFREERKALVYTPRLRHGANAEVRVDGEYLLGMRREGV